MFIRRAESEANARLQTSDPSCIALTAKDLNKPN